MVPAIIDHANGDHIVWESAAILTYLVERFDPNGGFLGTTIEERSTVSQWVNYQVARTIRHFINQKVEFGYRLLLLVPCNSNMLGINSFMMSRTFIPRLKIDIRMA